MPMQRCQTWAVLPLSTPAIIASTDKFNSPTPDKIWCYKQVFSQVWMLLSDINMSGIYLTCTLCFPRVGVTFFMHMPQFESI